MQDITLEVPGTALAVRRHAERDDPRLARAQVSYDALHDAILAGRVSALEEHEDALLVLNKVPLQLHELDVKRVARLTPSFRAGAALARPVGA